MSSQTVSPHLPSTSEDEIRMLYQQMLESWNGRNPEAIAALYMDDGEVVGFDGSQLVGRATIEAEMRRIFADHVTAVYVSKIRSLRLLSEKTAVLRAIVGMIPPGQADINPAVNAVQSLVAVKESSSRWRIALFQNTPAQFHGRPDLAQQLTEELQELLK